MRTESNSKSRRGTMLYSFLAFFLLYISDAHGQDLTIQQQRDDFDTLCVSLEQTHPDLFGYQTPAQYNESKDMIRRKLDKGRSISDFYLLIAPFVASIRDGHTNITPPATQERMSYLKNGGLTLPLRLRAENGRLLVDYPLLAQAPIRSGDEITRINGIEARLLLESIYGLLGAEKGNATKDKQLSPYLSTLLWYQYGWGDQFDFEVKRDKGNRKESMRGITQSEATAVMKAQASRPAPPFTGSINPAKDTAELRILNFYQLPELRQFCDSAFQEINARQIPNLILDIRNNSGGSSAGVDLLLSYLPHDAYRVYSLSELKVNKQTKAYHKEKHPDIYELIKDRADGTVYPITGEPVPANRDKSDTYKGNVTVLVDENTYSGASTFAHIIKRSNAGTVIGETGCPSTYFGNYLMFALPNSGLQYYIAFTKFHEE